MFHPFKTKDTSDETLMKQMAKGNEKAFAQLYDRYFEKLAWYAYSFLHDMARAEDVVQDVFMKIIQKPQQFDTDQKFSTWIYTIVANTSRNVLRNEQNRVKILANAGGNYSDTIPAQQDSDYKHLKERIHTIVAQLSEKERLLYTLRLEQGLSIARVAEITGMPEGSVKSGIHYLLKKFDQQLKDFRHGS